MAKYPVFFVFVFFFLFFFFRSISSYTQCFSVVDCPDMQTFLPITISSNNGYVWTLYSSKAVIVLAVFSNCHSRKDQTYPLSQTKHSTCDYIYA